MSEINTMLLCSSKFALPTMQVLLMNNTLKVVCIPAHCKEMTEQVTGLLKKTPVVIITCDKKNCTEILTGAISRHSIQLCLMATFSYKIPAEVYSIPEKGFYNLHPGPLPQYRGADPVFEQIRNRERQAGVTIHKLDEGLDTGDVVMKEMIPLLADDTYGLLTTKLADTAAKLTVVLLQILYFNVSVPSKKQDETKAGYFKRQGAEDIVIRWKTMDAATIVALSNACNPWNKGAVTKISNNIIRFMEVEKMNEQLTELKTPGTICGFDENSFTVATIQNEMIRVNIISIDEGILRAGKLKSLGIVAENCFEEY